MNTATDTPNLPEPPDTAAAEDAPEFRVRISSDQVQVVLDCPDPLADLERTLDRVMAAFKELHLPEFPDREMLQEFITSSAQPGEHFVRHPLIMGLAPVPSRNGELVWAREFFTQGWAVDEKSGRMDFWEPLERRGVNGGEEVGRVLPPRPGTSGLSVQGKEIAVATPRPFKLRVGKQVSETETEDGTRIFTADCDGRLRYANDTVTVDEIYVIQGDVSLETGNIHHKGAVTVQGDVKAGALIETDGDVAVKGLVEAATIRCGGDLIVVGGVVGDNEGTVEAGGDVQALYISEMKVTAGGDVVAKNEIAHADITCMGKVLVSKGRIAGGTTAARKGIRVAEAGASGSTTTLLIAGQDPTLEPALDAYRPRLHKMDEASSHLGEALRRYHHLPGSLTPELARARDDLQAKLDQITRAMEKMSEEMARLRAEAAEHCHEEIVVYEKIWSGTTVQLGNDSLYVRASVQKPRLVQRKKYQVKLTPMGDGNQPDD